jgi:hypothetical protein
MAVKEGLDPDLKPGTVVLSIDGQNAREALEERARAAWQEGGFFSSPQRARMLEFRLPLKGDRGDKHALTILVGTEPETLELVCDTPVRGWLHTYNIPEELTEGGRRCRYGELASGVGYIYLGSVDETTTDAIERAIAAYPDVPGWMVDLRGNGGGGYGSELQAQLRLLKQPVIGLVDAGTMSAGETLARDRVINCDARLFGETTGGASSAKRLWGFPSGMGSVSVPTRSRWGVGGRAIEFFGIDPHVIVEPEPGEVRRGLNSGILRAEEFIVGKEQQPL